ncbi:MAG: leucine-rich repeat domain-containing protein, partial [Prevotella sp.]|nr:leucine-rich repeat domain-containing protein [Prevotella sp.]
MKKFAFRGLLFVLLLFCSAPAWATFEVDGETFNGDFRVEYSRESATGETDTYYLYYNITSEEDADVKTVEVTYPYHGTSTQAGYYTGDVIIPEEVEYNDETYSVTAVGNYAFEYCSGLTSIEIPNSITSIGNYAFEYCSGLTSIDIPNSVTTIGDWAFWYCTSLTEVTIGEGVTFSGMWTFSYLTNLAVVNYNAANISNTTDNGPIFGYCTIGTFNIGANVQHLRQNTLFGGTTVSEMYSFNPEPPTLEQNAFYNSTIGVLYVPAGSEGAYATA